MMAFLLYARKLNILQKIRGAKWHPFVTALSQLYRSYASTSLTLSACDIIFPDLSNA